jgi:hypothetical protein
MRQQTGDDDVLVKKVCPFSSPWERMKRRGERQSPADKRWYMSIEQSMRLDGRNTTSSYSVSLSLIASRC